MEGTTKLDPAVLDGFLSKSFPEYRPACLETHQELEVTQKIKYNVVHVQGVRSRPGSAAKRTCFACLLTIASRNPTRCRAISHLLRGGWDRRLRCAA